MPRQYQLPVQFSDNRRCYRSDSSPGFICITALVALLSGYACLSEAGSAAELSQTSEPGGVLSSGHATAFGDAPRASDEELDRMRGGFIVNLSGLEFLMAFSIERLTFINGELVSSFTFNPFSLTPLTQLNLDINLPSTAAVVPAPIDSVALTIPAPSANPDIDNVATHDVVVPPATPHAAIVEGSNDTVPPVNVAPATQTADNGSTDTVGASSSGGSSDGVTASSPGSGGSNPQVARQGNLTFVQNGAGNFAFTAQDASALATVVQNSLNDQIISTITTMNINLAAQMTAARARLDTLINQGLSRLQ